MIPGMDGYEIDNSPKPETLKPEATPKTETKQYLICVCAKCGGHSSKSPLEFNFREQKIYQICPDCGHHNSMEIAPPPIPKPYPKTKTMR
jgi:hypothetical protein